MCVRIGLGTEDVRKNAEKPVMLRNRKTRRVPTPTGIVCSIEKKTVAPLLVIHLVPVAWAQSQVGDERSSRDARTKK